MTVHHNTVTFDGLGQGSEGNGHDAFSEMPYNLLNGIRIRDVKLGEKSVSLVADLASAYRPELGVDNFTRRFSFTAPGDFLVEDSIKTSKPEKVTSYFHSDNSIVKSNGGFQFETGKPFLFAEILEPKLFDAVIEPNIVTAPGPPGNVDKGEREVRGVRLAISPKKADTKINFKVRLRIRK